ncbi:hypothetical protein ACLKA6_013845, partial [Drosophila palustris]
GSSVEARPPRGVAEQVRKWGMKHDGQQVDPLRVLGTVGGTRNNFWHRPRPHASCFFEQVALQSFFKTHPILPTTHEPDQARALLSSFTPISSEQAYNVFSLHATTWAEFKSGFLELFLPPQYFERLEDQIRSRRQREGEGFKDYLIDIRALMHYAGYSDIQILRRVYENAAPEYK